MARIVVIGSGNLAEALLKALRRGGLDLVQLYARNEARGAHLAALCGIPHTSHKEELMAADLYLVAVSDRAVGEVTRELPIPEGAVVAHTAGSIPIEALPHARRGSFYPFQSFTAGREVDFSEIPLFIEASDAEALRLLREVAGQITRKCYEATSEQRRRIHLTGVFACNFVNALYGVGASQLAEAGLPYEILHPLMMETARKAVEADHPALVQTGPAVRGDKGVQSEHLALLHDETMRKIYQQLSELIWETSKKISQR